MASSRAAAWLPLAFVLAFGGGARAGGEASGDCAGAVSDRVQARYDGIDDLEARFTQRSKSVAFSGAGQEMKASGVAAFAKPGRMRWSYETPEPSLVVSDGETLWIYDPTAREVQEFPVGQGFLSGTAVSFLLGEGRIRDTFEVRAEGCGEPAVRLFLQPHEDATYERLELLVDAAGGDVRETAVVDLFGNRTEVAFEALRTNLSPAPETFRFTPGPEDRVLRAGAPPAGGSAAQTRGGSDSQ
jgi:outer membrane lipoprotein carrier protein